MIFTHIERLVDHDPEKSKHYYTTTFMVTIPPFIT